MKDLIYFNFIDRRDSEFAKTKFNLTVFDFFVIKKCFFQVYGLDFPDLSETLQKETIFFVEKV
jgi:hypothetical protein